MPEQWTTGVVIKLLEVAHGQWLYCCIQVHDKVQGTRAMQRKEELQQEIEAELDLDFDGWLEEDQYLAEMDLGNLEYTSGGKQKYWLASVRTAREAIQLWGISQPSSGCNRTAVDGQFITLLLTLSRKGDRLVIAFHSKTLQS